MQVTLLHAFMCKGYQVWAIVNILRHIENKTELMLVTSERTKHLHDLLTSLTVGLWAFHWTVILLQMNLSPTFHFELYCIPSSSRFMTSTVTATLYLLCLVNVLLIFCHFLFGKQTMNDCA